MRNIKKIHTAVIGLLAVIGALAAFAVISTTSQAVSSYRDCEDDAIMRCGALSQDELVRKYDVNESRDLHSLYDYYGISRSDMTGETAKIKMGQVYPDGRVVVDGETVATGSESVARVRKSDKSRPFTAGGTTFYEGPDITVFDYPSDIFALYKDGVFYRGIMTSCGNVVIPPPTPPKPPVPPTPPKPPVKPVYSCDSLTAQKVNRTTYTFEAAATAKNGATIESYTYNFGDSTTDTVETAIVTHEYEKPGTYNITVAVNVKVDEVVRPITSKECQVEITIEAPPVKPLYACDSLTARAIASKSMTYAFDLRYTAENGAALQKVVYDFGDSTTKTYEAAEASRVEHTYTAAGTYKVKATPYFKVADKEATPSPSAACEVTITIPPAPTPPTPPTPPELPQTGIASLVGGGMGLGSLTVAGYYWIASRKNDLDIMLNR